MKSGRKKLKFFYSIVMVILFVCSNMLVYAEAGTWITAASMSTARSSHRVAVIDGKIYAIGGVGSSVLSSVEEYDPATNAWTTKASMTTARSSHQVAVVNGKIYVIGGSGSPSYLNSVEEYDPATNTWTVKAAMATARASHQVAVVNGKIYAIGGSNGTYLKSVEEYDPATDTWTEKASMVSSRENFRTAVVNGKIYAIGGFTTGSTYLKTVEEYDPVIDTWTAKAPMNIVRGNFEAVIVDGNIYAVGGSGNSSTPSSVEAYDPVTNTWAVKASMTYPRYNFQAVLSAGKIYVLGGENNTSSPHYLNELEKYDPETNTWTTKVSMASDRRYFQAVVTSGKIYAIGGNNGSAAINTVEQYTLETTAPINLTATGGNAQVSLSWSAVTGATGYNVKRSEITGGPYTTIAPSVTETVYNDTSVVNGTTYYYMVSAVAGGSEITDSNEASATPGAPAATGNALLVITMTDGTEKEYDLTMTEVNAFIDWYDGRLNNSGKAYYIFDKSYNKGPFQSRKDYIVYDKILDFEVMQY